MAIRPFALTYPQLMQQAKAQGAPPAELARLHRAYDALERLSDGFHRAQGMPFICHLVRTASIVLAERLPVDVVIAAMGHSAYILHEFAGSCRGRPTAPTRRAIREALSPAVEELIGAYADVPWGSRKAVECHIAAVETYPEPTRRLLLLRLANELEDYLDLGMAYRGAYPFRERIDAYGDLLVALAQRLGRAQLAVEFGTVFAEHRASRLEACIVRNHKDAYELPVKRWGQASLPERWYRNGKRWLKRARARRTGTHNTQEGCHGRVAAA